MLLAVSRKLVQVSQNHFTEKHAKIDLKEKMGHSMATARLSLKLESQFLFFFVM